MTRALFVLLLAIPLATTAQIYKTTDENGNVVFTDQPPAGDNSGKRIELNPTNTAAPPPVITRSSVEEEPNLPDPVSYDIDITSPANETTIPMGPGNFSVTASINPAPGEGETLQLLVDGAPRGEPQPSSSWALTNVFRGAHDLTVSLLDAKGATLATSSPLRVYVMRPSINNRNRN